MTNWNGVCVPGVEAPVTCNNKVIGARFYRASGQSSRPPSSGRRATTTATGPTRAAPPRATTTLRQSHSAPTSAGSVAWRRRRAWRTTKCCGTTPPPATRQRRLGGPRRRHQRRGRRWCRRDQLLDLRDHAISSSTPCRDRLSVRGRRRASSSPHRPATTDRPASSVAHNGPWVTTVAASTHTRSVTKEITLGNGAKFTGIGTGPGVRQLPADRLDGGRPARCLRPLRCRPLLLRCRQQPHQRSRAGARPGDRRRQDRDLRAGPQRPH